MLSDLATLDYIPPGHAGAKVAFFISFVLIGLGGLFALLSMALRVRSLSAAQARENALHHQKPRPLSGGPERVIRGIVEVEGDNPVAVDVVITQRAENHTSKNSKSHSWKETSRAIVARPFKLRTEAGESIQVEPGDRVLVADGLETEHPANNVMTRLRRCDVKRGETFSVYGDLFGGPSGAGGPYRNAETGWVLRPSRTTGRMLLATETITERYVSRMQFLSVWAVILTVVWTGFHALVTVPFTVSAFWGKPGQALVTGTSTYITKNKNSRTTHYVVEASPPEGNAVKGEVTLAVYNQIVERRTTQQKDAYVPVLLGPKDFPDYLGTEAHLNGLLLGFAAVGWFAALLVIWSVYSDKAAWYDREKLNEPGGSGHWPRK